jgi:protein-S-isoprenylcysteine O-methyltransferase Ste14
MQPTYRKNHLPCIGTRIEAHMMRLTTFLAATAFLALMGILMFLIAGTINLPSIWLYLTIRVLFTAASVLAMSEEVARERLKPGPGVKPEPVYNIGATIAWSAHIVIVSLDLGRYGWSTTFPVWLQAAGVLGMLCAMGMVIWALRHNEYLSARIRIQSERGQRVADTGPYAYIRHPNYAGAFLLGLSSGLVFASWPSILPMLLYVGLLVYRTLNEEKVLLAELEGYGEYAARVRYRFVPGIW